MTNHIKISKLVEWLEDPRFWIAILFILRLYQINQPPANEHVWRQTMTLGVARNYLDWDPNFFHPRTLICDSRSGIYAQEFPVFNYVIFLGWKLFGEENWVFRLISLITCSFGLYWFYQIVKRLLNHRAAISAMVLFGCSIVFTYGRIPMPDVFAVSLALGGVYYGWKYLTGNKSDWSYAVLFFVLSMLGMLSKIPASVVMILLTTPMFTATIRFRRKVILSLMSMVSVSAVFLWYFVWVPWAESTYGHVLFFPRSLATGLQEILAEGTGTFERFHSIAMQSKIVFYICVIGAVTLILQKKHLMLTLTFALYSLVMFYFMMKAGIVFSTHDYYVIPYIPMMAICGGFALDYWFGKKQLLFPPFLLVFATIGIWNQWGRFYSFEEEKKYLRLEGICNQYMARDARILTSEHSGNPRMLYFCHRKGWTDHERWKDETWIAGEATVGMEFVVVERFRLDKPLSLPVVYEDEDFVIYTTRKQEQQEQQEQ